MKTRSRYKDVPRCVWKESQGRVSTKTLRQEHGPHSETIKEPSRAGVEGAGEKETRSERKQRPDQRGFASL